VSDGKDPFDPFGRNERTIIRPNPGGRRPAAPAQPQSPQPQYPPQQPYQPPPPQPGALPADAWADPSGLPAAPPAWQPPAPPPPDPYAQPYQPPPQQPLPPQPAPGIELEHSGLQRAPVELTATPNENPILRAAAPILLLLGRLRVALASASFNQLMTQVANAIQNFDADMKEAGVSGEHARAAKYAICATADDIVQNIPQQDRQLWTQYSMLSRFFGERMGGVRFFEEVDRAKQDPMLNYNVLELQHACLAIGFQGMHRTSAGGQATLQTIQRSIYETLRRVKGRVTYDLSPRWQGQAMAADVAPVRVPFWAVAAVVAALLVMLFLTLRSLLTGGVGAVIDDMGRVFPGADVAIERRVIQPVRPPPPPIRTSQLERIRAALATEIGEQKVSVDATPTGIIIRVGSFASFEPGRADPIPAFLPLADKIARTLEKEQGFIRVTGHSDNTRLSSNVRFASNHELSVARARTIAELLGKGLSDAKRLETDGKGETQPIAPNDTAEGRARNRRVDVLIPHER
jgi:type VI secretion system protein ImpK